MNPSASENHARSEELRKQATVTRARIALGTLVCIEATSSSAAEAERGVQCAFGAIRSIDALMHPGREQSDLRRINEASPGRRVRIASGTVKLLRLAQCLASLTNGIFDPCLPARPGRITDIELQDDDSVVCHVPVTLDFGGFAKGYAVDCAVHALIERNCTAGLVNAGGDIRAFGSQTRTLFLRGPRHRKTQIRVQNTALAVSHAGSRAKPPEHRGYYSRSRQARPLVNRFAAVTAAEAVLADALTKCVMLCPQRTAARAIEAFGASRLLAY